MNSRTIHGLLRTTVGALDQVDLVNRTIEVLVGPMRLSFDVPPVCEVVLNGEPVKLHFLQHGDTVSVVLGPGAGDCTAKRIDVASHCRTQRRKASAAIL
jgi:hypothetical protein